MQQVYYYFNNEVNRDETFKFMCMKIILLYAFEELRILNEFQEMLLSGNVFLNQISRYNGYFTIITFLLIHGKNRKELKASVKKN